MLHEVFENRHGQLKSGLDFAGISVHAHKRVAVEGRRDVLLDAVCAFLVADSDAQLLGFKLNFLLKDELVQDVPGVEAFEGLGDGVPAANFVELLAHFSHRDGLVAHFGQHVG